MRRRPKWGFAPQPIEFVFALRCASVSGLMLVALAVLLSACWRQDTLNDEMSQEPQESQRQAETYTGTGYSEIKYIRISPDEALTMMTDETAVLDVRTQSEFSEGHIRNAILLPHDEIQEEAKRILPDKNQKIFVYCRSGRRSEIAARELINMGYTKVYDIGGIVSWTGEIVRSHIV